MPAKPASVERAAPRRRDADVGSDVGQRLRAQRERSGVGLRELARRLGISPSAISQIETGRSRPSVSTLYAIVSELGVSLDELFSGAGGTGRTRPVTVPGNGRPAAQASATPETGGDHVQRAGSRKALELESGVRWERLTSHSDRLTDFLYMVYGVGGASSQGDQVIRHAGREYGLVLSGSLEVTLGADRYVLGPGDSISFDSSTPHCLRNVGDVPVHGVWLVIGRQGDHGVHAIDDLLDGLIEQTTPA